jgi:hypothetical protein
MIATRTAPSRSWAAPLEDAAGDDAMAAARYFFLSFIGLPQHVGVRAPFATCLVYPQAPQTKVFFWVAMR